MKVEIACTNCGASFAADSTKIPEAGVRVRCATCKETFLARLPARSGTADGARPGHQATGQRASKPKASPAESARPQRNPDQRFGGERAGLSGSPSGDQYRDALTAVLDDVSASRHREGAQSKRRGIRGRTTFLVLLALMGMGAGAWANYQYSLPPDPPPPGSQQRAAAVMMFSAVMAVERHRQTTGELPAAISALNLPRADWSYLPVDTGYTLIVSLPDASVTHRSGEDALRLLSAAGVR